MFYSSTVISFYILNWVSVAFLLHVLSQCNFYSRGCVQGQDDGWVRTGADFLPLGTDHSFDERQNMSEEGSRRGRGSCTNKMQFASAI